MDTLSSYLPSLSGLVAFEAVARWLGFTCAGKELNGTPGGGQWSGYRPGPSHRGALAPFSDAHYVILRGRGDGALDLLRR